MALPPVSAVAEDAPPAPAGDEPASMPMAEGEGEATTWQPVATILTNTETGAFKLVSGDEPEDGSEPEGPTFDTPQALMKGVMERLNNGDAAEASFGKAFRGEPDEAPAAPAAPMPKAAA